MHKHTKVLLLLISCFLIVVGFFLGTLKGDHELILEQFLHTTNLESVRKYLAIGEFKSDEVETADVPTGESKTDEVIGTPKDSTSVALEQFVQNSNISDTRKKIVLEGLDCYNKKVMYHQLRSGVGSPAECYARRSCNGKFADGASEYDFESQAEYNLEDPIYLDCSYFIKHCYWAAGIEISGTTSDSIYDSSEFTTINKEEMLPGDVGVRRGHCALFVTFSEEGLPIWVEMADHANNCTISVGDKREIIYRRYNYAE